MKIAVQLTGIPKTLVDGLPIKFPTKKTELIFYYLLLKKKSGRDTLATVFWPKHNTASAKKNVRNALYYIKKNICDDIILMDKNTVSINTDLDIYVGMDPKNGELLEGFVLDEYDVFDSFIHRYKQNLEIIYIETIKKEFFQNIITKKETSIVRSFHQVIELDPYDEDIYRQLMQYYMSIKKYTKAMEYYLQLVDVLKADLDIDPGDEIRSLYNQLLRLRKNHLKEEKPFYGRGSELLSMNLHLTDFLDGAPYKHLLLTGFIGAGKTALLQKFLKKYTAGNFVINITCYEAEELCYYKMIGNVCRQILQFADQCQIFIPYKIKELVLCISGIGSLEKAVSMENISFSEIYENVHKLFHCLWPREWVILAIDDIQFADPVSINILSMLTIGSEKHKIFIAASFRDVKKTFLEKWINSLLHESRLYILNIAYFTEDETRAILKRELNRQVKPQTIKKIFEETKGNPLYLFEYIESIQVDKKIEDFKFLSLLRHKQSALLPLEKTVLNLASLFFDALDPSIIASLLKKDELEIIMVVENLCLYGFLIEEYTNGQFVTLFAHEEFRKFIYNSQSYSKRRYYHNLMGHYYENSLVYGNSDFSSYDRTIYHYKESGNQLLALTFQLKKLELLVNPQVEFPEFFHQLTEKYIQTVEKEIKQIPEDNPLVLEFLLSKGIFKMKTCHYNEGLACIRQVIDSSNVKDLLVKAYLQMIHYCIQVRNLALCYDYIQKTLELLGDDRAYIVSKNRTLRLFAMLCIMERRFAEAGALLEDLTAFFENANLPLDLATVYNYKGYIYKYDFDYEKAIPYYEKAISICKKANIIQGLVVFYTNMGQSYYALEDYGAAKTYFLEADNICKKGATFWGRALTETYLALLYLRDGHWEKAKKYLIQGRRDAIRLKNPYEDAYFFKAQLITKLAAQRNKKVNTIFGDLLKEDTGFYFDLCIKAFAALNFEKEVEMIKELRTCIHKQ